jgi:predicted transcriptional regulator
MHKSKLELYEDMLRALAKKPLTLDSIAYECNMDCVVLQQRLNFLTKNNLIEEKNYKNKTIYALTRRGTAISKTLTITKRLEKLQTTIKKLNETMQALPALSELSEEKAKRA